MRALRTLVCLFIAACSVANAPDDLIPPSVQGEGGAASCGGQADCGGTCVDLLSDPANCGACGNECSGEAVCNSGTCAAECTGGTTDCDGSCLDLSGDIANCGECGRVCEAPANATASCDAGSCSYSCDADRGDCNEDPSDGCETDLTNTAAHCGACDATCLAPPQATVECVNSTCQFDECITGFMDCDAQANNGCEAPVEFDEANCNFCTNSCGASQLCIDASCENLRTTFDTCGVPVAGLNVLAFRPSTSPLLTHNADDCSPNSATQVMLVLSSGIANLAPAATLQSYVQNGGIIIASRSTAREVFNRVFNTDVFNGPFTGGNCSLGNVGMAVQFSPGDQVWFENTFPAQTFSDTGCGFDVGDWPGVVPLAGWSTTTVSFGYRDLGQGRVWLLSAEWDIEEEADSQPLVTNFMRYIALVR